MGDTSPLARVPLFAGLAEADLAELSAGLRARRYRRGETIFLCGAPGESLCVVESGLVRLGLTSADGREMVLALMGPGDFFGELALLDGRPRSADAVAAEETRLLLLSRERFLRVLEARPRVAIELLQVLSERIRRDTQLLQDAVFLDVPARLAAVLLRLAGAADRSPDAATSLPVRLSQAALASMVGTSRESVNRWLGAFEQQGLIRRASRQIVLLRPDDLRERIG